MPSSIIAGFRTNVPFWLPRVAWLVIRLANVRRALTGIDVSDREADAFGRWYSSHTKVEAVFDA